MKIISNNASENSALALTAYQEFLRILEGLGKTQDTVTIGLSGGSSLLAFYRVFGEKFGRIDGALRPKIRFAFLDERLVPLDHADSNYRLLYEVLFERLLVDGLIASEQIYAVKTELENPELEYFSRVPHIDIGLFGVGPDGHIASLFPQHMGLQNTSKGYIEIGDSPKPPSHRISVSKNFVQSIPIVFLFFMGEAKREVYAHFLDKNILPTQIPAKYVLFGASVTVVTDLVV
ncbi:MAG: 6-phosphogluconolactonase [Candidatus Gracilibacteria bacterium]|nr:6-phosphogluconolactonase [Candidatus Gracilibacteria bacterium]